MTCDIFFVLQNNIELMFCLICIILTLFLLLFWFILLLFLYFSSKDLWAQRKNCASTPGMFPVIPFCLNSCWWVQTAMNHFTRRAALPQWKRIQHSDMVKFPHLPKKQTRVCPNDSILSERCISIFLLISHLYNESFIASQTSFNTIRLPTTYIW